MTVELEKVAKSYGSVEVLHELDLATKDGEFLVLLGASGSGKTTALRMIAGLETVSRGRIRIAGRDVTEVLPKNRDVAMVFQSYALYPHKTVFENIGYPLKVRGFAKSEIETRVKEVAEQVQLSAFLERYPRQLSGGQRQRVALGRAIVRRPVAFLMDEPLSNLDAKLRGHMRAELKHMQHELGITTIYVTHDQVEAMTLAHRIALLEGGKLQQLDTPARIYNDPANLFVAQFIGSPPMNLMAGELAKGTFRVNGGLIRTQGSLSRKRAVLGVRPEDCTTTEASAGKVSGTVYATELLGDHVLVTIKLSNDMLTIKTAKNFSVAIGSTIGVDFPEDKLFLFDAEDGSRVRQG
jgi:multiple sugar transport system ATP-binding protein